MQLCAECSNPISVLDVAHLTNYGIMHTTCAKHVARAARIAEYAELYHRRIKGIDKTVQHIYYTLRECMDLCLQNGAITDTDYDAVHSTNIYQQIWDYTPI